MLAAWSEFYSNATVWRTLIQFLHLGGLLVGAGCAIAADRITLQAKPGDARTIEILEGTHRIVLAGLAAMSVSGALMVAADFDHFVTSKWFWTKLGLIVVLLGNGVRLSLAEQSAREGHPSGWPRLRSASMASLVLWVLVTLFGAILPNV